MELRADSSLWLGILAQVKPDNPNEVVTSFILG